MKQRIASMLILLILSIPFYSAGALAQTEYADPGNPRGIIGGDGAISPSTACTEKSEEGNLLTTLMDSAILDILERLLRILHALDTLWELAKYSYETIHLILMSFPPTQPAGIALHAKVTAIDNPLSGTLFMDLVHYLVTCQLPNVPNVCNLAGDYGIPLGPLDNIYTAVGCLCLPGILFNMRKLQTIYKVYNCCVDEACESGTSTESCDSELDQSLCMFWGKGALINGLIGIIQGVAVGFIMKYLFTEWTKSVPPIVGAAINLAMAPMKFEQLMAAIEKIQKVFEEPDCSTLSKKKDDAANSQSYTSTSQSSNCRYEEVDLNKDGIADRLDYVCGPVQTPTY